MNRFTHVALNLISLTLPSFCIYAAQATSVTNISNQPQTIEVQSSAGYVAVTIPAGHTWRLAGDANIRHNKRELRLESDKEYTIWNNNQLGPQKHKNQMRGRF